MKSSVDNSIPTTKTDASKHGFGLFSLNRLAEKYGRSIKLESENNIFKISLSFDLN